MPFNFQTYTLLCKSDIERAEWKEKIIPLLEQNEGIKNLNVAVLFICLCQSGEQDLGCGANLMVLSIFILFKTIFNRFAYTVQT